MESLDNSSDAIIICVMAFVVVAFMLLVFIGAVLKAFDKMQFNKLKNKL